jgi:rhodanese-related sulfurtransferase
VSQPSPRAGEFVAESARFVSDLPLACAVAAPHALGMTTQATVSLVTRVAPASPGDAQEHFSRRLAFETDCADVARDLRLGTTPYTIVDVRSSEHYAAGHLPGAVNAPSGLGAADLPDGLLVLYCWGPGCNGADGAAARLTAQGRQVKTMLGGFEYWVREGQPVEGTDREALAERADPALVG